MSEKTRNYLLVLRADADSKIGAGHVMRCLALAQAWLRQGGKAIFMGCIGVDSLRKRIENEGCMVQPLPAAHPDSRDLQAFTSWLLDTNEQPGWVVLDGYQFDAAYQQGVRSTGWRLLVIDDFAHLPAYHADILLNPNDYGNIVYHTDTDTLRLLGSPYVLLRQEFWQLKPLQLDHSQRLFLSPHRGGNEERSGDQGLPPYARILVTMGGGDFDNVSGRVVDALVAMGRNDLDVKIVIGPLNPHRQALTERLLQSRLQVELLTSVENMVPHMQWADLAISAGGSTCWELAALGVPMVVTILAENQERVAASLVSHEVAVSLGWFQEWRPRKAASVIQELLADQERRRQMGENGQRLVDGQGCERVINHMEVYHECTIVGCSPFSAGDDCGKDRPCG